MTTLHEVFLAQGPDPALGDKLQLFGQFVGSWDVVVTNHRPDGSAETIPAEWLTPDSFSWRAVDSKDDGDSWKLLQEMKARRRSP